MRVLLTGGTGCIGSSVLDRFVFGGHQVAAVVRSEEEAEPVRAEGVEPAVADLSDGDVLQELAAVSDGVVRVASPGGETGAAVDELGEALLIDQQVLGGTARRVLGWFRQRPSILGCIACTDF